MDDRDFKPQDSWDKVNGRKNVQLQLLGGVELGQLLMPLGTG